MDQMLIERILETLEDLKKTLQEKRGDEEQEPRLCPFCGGKLNIEAATTWDTTVFYPRCNSDECVANQGWVSFPTREKAIQAWNRRV